MFDTIAEFSEACFNDQDTKAALTSAGIAKIDKDLLNLINVEWKFDFTQKETWHFQPLNCTPKKVDTKMSTF